MHRYFRCRSKCGVLVKPSHVKANTDEHHQLGAELTVTPDLHVPGDAGQKVGGGKTLYHTTGQRWGPEGWWSRNNDVSASLLFSKPPMDKQIFDLVRACVCTHARLAYTPVLLLPTSAE